MNRPSKILSFLLEYKTLGIITWISLVFGIIPLVYQKTTEVTYEVISDSNVFEIKQRLSKLDVLYDGKSLKENNQGIRVINLKIINSGDNTIRLSDYDPSAPLGLSIERGEIMEPPQILTTKDYLKKHLKVSLDSKQSISFSSAILEPKDFFLVNMLVLVNDPLPPVILPYGTIAGATSEKPLFKALADQSKNQGVLAEAVAGGAKIQALRALLYTAGFFGALLSLATFLGTLRGIVFYFEDKGIRKERINAVNAYIDKYKLKFTRIRLYIFKEFTDRIYFYEGGSGVRFEDISDLQALLESYKNDSLEIEKPNDILSARNSVRLKNILARCEIKTPEDVDKFIEEITKELATFMEFLKENNISYLYSMRDKNGINLFVLDPYSGEPDFKWWAS